VNYLYTFTSSNSKFLPFYIVFLIVSTFERINSTFIFTGKKITKIIYHRWAFIIPLSTYLLILFTSMIEFFLTVKIVNLIISLIGFVIFIAGVLLRKKSISGLGENWSLYIEIKEGHELITDGVYKILKHPYCLAVIFELIGVCLLANAFFSLIMVFLIQAPLLLIRVNLEERVLIDYFGDAYRRYIRDKIL